MYAMSIYYISTYHLNRVIKLYLFYINLLYHTVLPYARALGARQSLVAEKQAIKTRKRCAQPYPTAREKRLERDNKKLREENNAYRRLERVVRAIAAKGGIDYDALAQETATSESKATLSRENDGDGQDASDQDNLDGGDH